MKWPVCRVMAAFVTSLHSEKWSREFEELLINISPGDLTLTKITGFQSGKSFGWGDVNLGKGWRPGT
jgi:hypothetical protein